MGDGFGYLERRSITRALRRLGMIAERGSTLPPSDLRDIDHRLGLMRRQLDRARVAVGAALMDTRKHDDRIARPDQCDWAFRGLPWRAALLPGGGVITQAQTELATGIKLFHDSDVGQLSWRQSRSMRTDLGAAHALRLEVYEFDGSFVSIVQDLPPAAMRDLTLQHLFRVELHAEIESPTAIYARLNVLHGPNCEKIVRPFAFKGSVGVVDYELADKWINEKRVSKIWLDIIFEQPRMTRIDMHDMTITRTLRADL